MDLNKSQHNYTGKREAGEMYVGGGYGQAKELKRK